MINEEIIKLWTSLEDIPIDGNECIEQDFYIWEKGTEKFAIWHWFDEEFQNGVYDLVYKKVPIL